MGDASNNNVYQTQIKWYAVCLLHLKYPPIDAAASHTDLQRTAWHLVAVMVLGTQQPCSSQSR